MGKFRINTTLNYSPNFELKKRKSRQIKFIIFHYTGMKREKDAIKKLTNINSRVSCHFLIKNNGEILTLVPELYIAWHAGVSNWQNFKSINNYSIGIEISNPGHENNYKNFSKKQIKAILKISLFLKKKYKIQNKFFLGHSDISPNRKKDPGEKFPWEYLSKKKIGYWHNLNKSKISKFRNIKTNKIEKKIFIKKITEIGYVRNSDKKNKINTDFIVKAFQRRFRPNLINGEIDKECLIICKNIANKMK
tara:strand:- start:118 stop:864 length:747 start_codon:yes stop_codon:yes gene_type:complete